MRNLSLDTDPYHVGLVKELTLKFSIARMRTWFMGAWREEYRQELDDAMKGMGRKESLSENDYDEIRDLFACLDAMYWALIAFTDTDFLLDEAIEAWLTYLEAKSAPIGSSDYIWG